MKDHTIVIGFEMFPRRVQKALDQWVAGELSEAQFLAASDWNHVWSTDFNLVMWNRQYIDIYGFPPSALYEGVSLEEVVRLSTRLGNFDIAELKRRMESMETMLDQAMHDQSKLF